MLVASLRRVKPETQPLVKYLLSSDIACNFGDSISIESKWLQLSTKHVH